MVVPGFEACDTLVWVLGTLRCALDVCGGAEGWVFSCLPFCHAVFLGGFHWFSEGYAPWLRGACMVAYGVVVFVCVFGLGFWRGIVGRFAVVLRYVLSHGVFGLGIRGVRVIFGGNLGQNSIFGVFYAECASVLVVVLG
jgi:hypothetical protein